MSDAMHPIDLTCDDVRDLAGAFVLGALGPADESAVRDHLASCSEAHAEIAEVGAVLAVLDASVLQVEPSAGLKTRLLAAAAADLEMRRAPNSVPSSVAPVVAFPGADARAARPSRGTARLAWAMRIAAVVVIGVLGGWNLLLQGQLSSARTYEANVASVLALAGEQGSLTAILTPVDGAGAAGLAAVGADGTMVVAMRDLAPTVGNEVYEAWMIGPDGAPVALGSFKVGESGTAYFRGSGVPAAPGIVLALTREPAPGATAPSTPPVSVGTTT